MTSCSTAWTCRGSTMGTRSHADQRIADQLAGPVKGDVPPAVDRDQLGADRGRIDQHVVEFGVPSQCVNGRMVDSSR